MFRSPVTAAYDGNTHSETIRIRRQLSSRPQGRASASSFQQGPAVSRWADTAERIWLGATATSPTWRSHPRHCGGRALIAAVIELSRQHERELEKRRNRLTPVSARVRVRVLALALASALAASCGDPSSRDRAPAAELPDTPPPNGGYFGLSPVGRYASLPGDAAAAAEVHKSSWEVRPQNASYNRTVPAGLRLQRVNPASGAYDPRWNKYILSRITGDFTGTTDEIFQWVAAKWGMPDNLIRTIAFVESTWYQSNYGDFVYDRAQCPAGFTKLPCPVTFGIVGTKSTSWPGIFPWNRDSTAAAVDVLGAWLRGCYEGWVWWLRNENRSHGVYRAGDIWGCVGAWYSGNWHDGSPSTPDTGENYIAQAQYWLNVKPWLRPGF